MPDLQSGTVTLLFTDVENSTRLWEQRRDSMSAALARHDALAEEIIRQHGGALVKPRGEGDSLFITFALATNALKAAVALQSALLTEPWPPETPIKVRMALHTGDVEARDGDYYGSAVNRCARIRAIGHGGQILLSQSAVSMANESLPDGAFLEPMGSHRLKDLQRPETVWQLRHPDWPADFPPLRSLDIYKHNLPRQLTSFIGREADIQQVKELLTGKTEDRRWKTEENTISQPQATIAHPEHLNTRTPERQTAQHPISLLALTGSGGSGKTRLALQVAAELIEAYEDGVWLVELAALPINAGEEAVAKAIAGALRIKEQPGQETTATVREHLASKSLLLLMDNCEHLETDCARVLRSLLLHCPHLHILATSREHLSVPGAVHWPVPPLPFPPKDARLTLADALQYEAVRLFVERASVALSTFRLTVGNLPHVVQICRRLDGIPLALELATARVSVMGVKQIADRLEQALRFLKSDSTEPRHQTLRAVIEWSYSRLEESEKTLLRRLSVFVGGWTLEACEAVCAWGDIEEWEIIDLLARLVRTSLVTMQDAPEASRKADEKKAKREEEAEESPCRYYLLETLRQFGQEKLEEFGNTEQARNQHLQYFLNLAEQAEPELTGPYQAQWLERLEAEHDNLRTALTWAVKDEARLRLSGALWRFWYVRGYLAEGLSWLNGSLLRARNVSPRIRAKALNGKGFLAASQGDYDTAAAAYTESLQLRQDIQDQGGTAETLSNLGMLAHQRGANSLARQYHEQSLTLRRELKDSWGTATSLNNLGNLARLESNYTLAYAYYDQSLQIYRLLGDTAHIAVITGNLGDIAFAQQDYAAARRLFEESLATFREQGNKLYTAILLHNLGGALHLLQEHNAACPALMESLSLQVEFGYCDLLPFTLTDIAKIACNRQKHELAATLLGMAEQVCAAAGIQLPEDLQQDYTEQLVAAKDALDEQRFTEAWNTGQMQPLAYVVAQALSELDA